MEENMLKEDFKQGREYFDNVLAEAEKLPLRYAYNFFHNAVADSHTKYIIAGYFLVGRQFIRFFQLE